jgi:hypothetical protein
LAVLGAVAIAKRANAQQMPPTATAVASPPHLIILVDQSGSIVNRESTQRLAQKATERTLAFWQMAHYLHPSAAARIDFFGSQTRRAAGPELVSDPRWPERLQRAFAQSVDLGATEHEQALKQLLADSPAPADVVLISDGLPDPIGQSDAVGQQAYADLLVQLAARLAERGTRLSVVLIGDVNRARWFGVWQAMTDLRSGTLIEVRNESDISKLDRALSRLYIAAPTVTALPLSATPTSAPSSTVQPSATPTLLPNTATPLPQPTSTSTPIVQQGPITPAVTGKPSLPTLTTQPSPTVAPVPQSPSSTSRSSISLWAIGGGLLMLLMVVLVLATRRPSPRYKPAQALPTPAADEGWLEVHGGDDLIELESPCKFELRKRVLGEILTIGYENTCDIRLPSPTGAGVTPASLGEQAILTLTPRGPLIESRRGQLLFEGRVVRQHLLYDGDLLELDRCQLCYRNFFRQRPSIDE